MRPECKCPYHQSGRCDGAVDTQTSAFGLCQSCMQGKCLVSAPDPDHHCPHCCSQKAPHECAYQERPAPTGNEAPDRVRRLAQQLANIREIVGGSDQIETVEMAVQRYVSTAEASRSASADKIGRLAEWADIYIKATALTVSSRAQIDVLTAGLRELRDGLRKLYVELGGEDA